MEPNLPSGSGHKRPRPMDDIADVESLIENPTAEKRVRFPKGKKAKPGDAPIHIVGPQDGEVAPADARAAAKERELRRRNEKIEMFGDDGDRDGAVAAEVEYQEEEYDGFAEDGDVPIDPFNLEKEREEGYFDENGNFVEYVEKNQVKDAWLDSIAAGGVKLYTPKPKTEGGDDVEREEEHIGKIKRRIADVLEEGETVLQALRRLKGNAKGDKKVKMSSETKRVFDQLTEDAMTLLDKHGEYNVNQEQKEIFEREAQGYESLERARNAMLTGNGDEGFDMFGDDEDNAAAEQQGNGNGGGVGSVPVVNDYVLDEGSGYYYSSSLGYYYDPATGLYCSAASGVWYSYNEDTGAYDEVPQHDQAAAAAAAAAETVVN